MATKVINVTKWIEENKSDFQPPICNKLMHKHGQMKLFFVGGPNNRKDFHVECGEELFYQLKGDMCLKLFEQGKHRDLIIKEGQMFHLPANIQHSPQRFANTIGMVAERDRHPGTELDGLRYFMEKDGQLTPEEQFEDWFYCDDIVVGLAKVVRRHKAMDDLQSGKKIPSSLLKEKPLRLDNETKLQDPINWKDWLDSHRNEIHEKGKLNVFDTKYQLQVFVYGRGKNSNQCEHAETWLWQLEGSSAVNLDSDTFRMDVDDSLLVPQGKRFTVEQSENSLTLVVYQDPSKAETWSNK